jgi:NitT/TauT family transport system substrate-binding protein
MSFVMTRRRMLCTTVLGAGAVAAQPIASWAQAGGKPTTGVYPVAVPGYQVMYVAAAQGFLKDEGLDIKLIQGGSGTKTREIFASGQADFAIADILHCLQLNNRGRPSRALCAADTRSPSVRWTIRQDLYEQGIDTIQKLAAWKRPDGRKPIFGVSSLGGTAHLWAHHYASRFGVADEFVWVGVGNVDTMLGSLKTRQIDILSATVSIVTDAESHGWGKLIFNGGDADTWNKTIGGTVPVNVNMCLLATIQRDPAKVQAYVNGVYRAACWIKEHSPEEIYGAIEPYVGSTSRAGNILEIAAVKEITDFDGDIDAQSFARGGNVWFGELSGIKPLQLADAFDPTFIRAAHAKYPG